MLKRRRNARCTAVADSVLMNSRTQKFLCCIVAILLSTDAAARRQVSALAVVYENVGPPFSNVIQIIHIPYIFQEIQTYETESLILNHPVQSSFTRITCILMTRRAISTFCSIMIYTQQVNCFFYRREKTSWQTKKQMERSSNERYKNDKERYQFSEQQKRMEEAG